MKILVLQPHSDDAILSCSKYLLNTEKYEKVKVLTVEKNDKRLKEDSDLSQLIGVPYLNLGVEVKDDYYHDFFERYGRNAELTNDNVLEFYAGALSNKTIEDLYAALNAKVEKYRKLGYTILCPLGIGHPFHYLVRMLIENQKGFIYYKEFPHAYKRKAAKQLTESVRDLTALETYDVKEISELKYQIAQKCYKSQSGFFFYEHDKILKNLPEEFFTTLQADSAPKDKHVKIYVISKGRPNGKSFKWLKLGKIPYTVVVEPQDYEAYRDAGHENILTLPENDRGFSYTVNYSKNQFDGVNPVMIMDDDINNWFYSIPGIAKCSLSMKTEEELATFFAEMDKEICSTDFELGTIGKSAFDWNCEDVSPKFRYSGIPVVIIINSKRLTKFDLDTNLCFKSDIDYALKCMYLGVKYAKFVHFLQQTKMNKDGKQEGGLAETYKKQENLIRAQNILLERWPENVKIDEKKKENNGVPELRIIYKIFNTPPVIDEVTKLLSNG